MSQGNSQRPTHFAGATTTFGWDFTGPAGRVYRTGIHAAATGDVVRAAGGCNPRIASGCNGGWGNWVSVRVADGSCARYAHLADIRVSEGDRIGRYHVIGTMGNSGASSGPHLHFQREFCTRGQAPRTMPSSFIDAGVPRAGASPVSRNSPEQPEPPPFTARLDAQAPAADSAGNITVVAGGPSFELAFNARFNQPFDAANFVLRPVTVDNVNRFVSVKGDFPGARPPNDGAVGYFRARVSAPANTPPGRYFVQWNAINKRFNQFGGLQPSFNLLVKQPSAPDYGPPRPGATPFAVQFVDQSIPKVINPGEEATVQVRVRNAGSSGWDSNVRLATPDDSPVRLASGGLFPNSNNRVGFIGQDPDAFVAPNEIATFTYRIRGPADRATAFRQRFDLVREGTGPRFGQSLGIYLPTVMASESLFPPELTAADCTWAFVSQTGSPVSNGRVDVRDSQKSNFSFTIRNTSDLCPWFAGGSSPARLSTRRPLDRGSGFADTSDGWINPSRVRLPNAVPPGEAVAIPFGLRAQPGVPTGDYNEFMAPVIEGRFHLEDKSMFIPVRRVP